MVVGRAGMDVKHHQRSKGQRANGRRILQESARHLDPKWTAKQARRNLNVDPSRTSQNVLMVNDGQGGYRVCTDVEEVLDYGDARVKRVGRKLPDNAKTLTGIVGHLPKSMCEERTRTDANGKQRRYYVPKDDDEARRYFEAFVAYVGRQLAGGQAAIHGYAINHDEMTPHIQVMADTFGPDPKAKDPDALRQMFSQTWGQHREVKDARGKVPTGATKMRGYQAGLREEMLAQGFEVEELPDPRRSRRKQDKDDFVELAEGEEAVAQREDALAQREADLDHYAEELDAEAEENEARRVQYVAAMEKHRQAREALEASLERQAKLNEEARRSLEEARRLLDEAGELVPTTERLISGAYRQGVVAGALASTRFVAKERRQAQTEAVKRAQLEAPTAQELRSKIEERREPRRRSVRERIDAAAARLDARRSPGDRGPQRD